MSNHDKPGGQTPLNPALTSRTENTYDLSPTPPPVETTSASEGEGEGWPVIWLLVVVAAIVLALYFIL